MAERLVNEAAREWAAALRAFNEAQASMRASGTDPNSPHASDLAAAKARLDHAAARLAKLRDEHARWGESSGT